MPDAELRRRLVARWHESIGAKLDVDEIVGSTVGYSFAEMEELRNLLVMQFFEKGDWDLQRALDQFEVNRQELASQSRHRSASCRCVATSPEQAKPALTCR